MSSIIRDTDSRRDYSTSYHEWLHEQSRQGLPSDIASQVCTITQSILRRYRKAARDHGHLDPFLREADEAFADEMATAYGVCRVPVPLMIPLGANLYFPFYAVLLGEVDSDASCWDAYHRGLTTIMQRVARRMGVSTTLPTVYLEVVEFGLLEGMEGFDMSEVLSEHAGDTEMVSTLSEPSLTLPPAITPRAVWPQASSSRTNNDPGTWVELSGRRPMSESV